MLLCVYKTGVSNTTVVKFLRIPKLSGQGFQRWSTTTTDGQRKFFDEASLAAAKPFDAVPSFKMLPYIGTAWIYLPIIGRYSITKFTDSVADKHKTLGHLFREKVGHLNIVFTSLPDDMQTLCEKEGLYPARGSVESMKAYRKSRKQWYSTLGILITEGKEWYDLRSKAEKHFLNAKAIQAFLYPMQDIAKDFVENIYNVRDSNKEVPDVLQELSKWSIESIALVGFDTRLGCLKKDLPPDSDGLKMIQAIQTQMSCINQLEPFSGNMQFWKLFPTPTWKKYVAASDMFSEIAFKHINRALEKLKSSNEDTQLTLLQAMLKTKGIDVSDTLVLTADMVMAGIDTTSHVVAYFLYHMAKNPKKQEMVYSEIMSLLPRREDRITTETFKEFTYLKACMKESQRLLPISGKLARCLNHDIILSGYRIPAKTMIVANFHEVYKDPKYYPEPEKYEPERWLQNNKKFHSFTFVPYGAGARSCIGSMLADLEMICVSTEIIKNFKIEYHHEDIKIVTRLVSTPDKPLRLAFVER